MPTPLMKYDDISDTLYISFAPGEKGTGLALNENLLLRVNKAVADALKTKELVDFMQAGGLNAASSTPEQFADILKRDIKVWGDAIRASGIKFD